MEKNEWKEKLLYAPKNGYDRLDAEERAAACAQPLPKSGELYHNREIKGSGMHLTVKVNRNDGKGELIKIYTGDDILASALFVNGNGKASCRLPGGTYHIKAGVGEKWYGTEDAFGWEGSYRTMLFNGGEEYVQLDSGYNYTITVNVEENDRGEGIGSAYEDYGSF